MEDLSDLELGESALSDVDNLYLDFEPDSDAMVKPERPASTASFASWTFSPIQEDDSSEIVDLHHTAKPEVEPVTPSQHLYIVANPAASGQQQGPPATVTYNQQQLHQTHNNASEYYFPNNITYHHSVNIHNYVGNYCAPSQPVRRDTCMWEGVALPSVPETCQDRAAPPPVMRSAEPADPLAGLAAQGLEFTRCSTPEYLMALNSLHQLDSPPKPNHSAALDFSCSSFEESGSQTSFMKQQDSGYSSDLNVSPVIQFQGGHAKMAAKPPMAAKRHTSTPNPYQQYLTIAPMQLFQKNNLAHLQQDALQHRLRPIPGFTPKLMCAGKPSPLIAQPMYPTAYNLAQMPHPASLPKKHPSPAVTSTSAISLPDSASASVNVVLKKKDNLPKPKPKPEITKPTKTRHTCDSSSSCIGSGPASRRRHNEPLNNNALEVMNTWYVTHKENPYPSKVEKEQLARAGGISLSQVKSWFANKRNRNNNTRPKKQKQVMEERLLELCHELARDARRPTKDNAYYIQQLSGIMENTTKNNPLMM